jgi:hypothetical protein
MMPKKEVAPVIETPEQRKAMFLAMKNAVVSQPWCIYCSECRWGWNGQGSCYRGGSFATRNVFGCHQGQLIVGLKHLYYAQCVRRNWTSRDIRACMLHMGVLPPTIKQEIL